jgi:hypothetical protein
LVSMINRDDEEGGDRWIFKSIQGNRWSHEQGRRNKIDVLVKWQDFDEPTWEPLDTIKKEDPVTLAQYARENRLLDKSMWMWAKRYVKDKAKIARSIRRLKASKRKTRGIRYQFGVRVPRTLNEAYELDALNNDTAWTDAIKKEVQLLYEE